MLWFCFPWAYLAESYLGFLGCLLTLGLIYITDYSASKSFVAPKGIISRKGLLAIDFTACILLLGEGNS